MPPRLPPAAYELVDVDLDTLAALPARSLVRPRNLA